MPLPPLHLAVKYGHPEVVKLLLAAGADKDMLDLHGHSPLYYATENKNLKLVSYSEIFEMLFSKVAYLGTFSKNGDFRSGPILRSLVFIWPS